MKRHAAIAGVYVGGKKATGEGQHRDVTKSLKDKFSFGTFLHVPPVFRDSWWEDLLPTPAVTN